MCSKKCGGGISYRKRKCIPSKCPDPYYKKCDGNDYEEKKCNELCCPGLSAIQSLHKQSMISCSFSQKNHTGVYGRTGLSVARSVEVEYLTERGSVFHQNVHTLIPCTTNAMEMIMKKRNVINSAVQVCYTSHSFVYTQLGYCLYSNSKTILG